MTTSSTETALKIRWNMIKCMEIELDCAYREINETQRKHDAMRQKACKTGEFIRYLKSLDETSHTANAIVTLEDVEEESWDLVKRLESLIAGLEGKISKLETMLDQAME